jgi:hypothetical protein
MNNPPLRIEHAFVAIDKLPGSYPAGATTMSVLLS